MATTEERNVLTHRPKLIGIAGGTGAGKTTIAQALQDTLGENHVIIIPQDMYYRDRSRVPPKERENINYDHPDAIENELLLQDLKRLKAGHPIEMPVYDFKTHTRKRDLITVQPAPIIVIEGITLLINEDIRELLDYKIYVDTDPDVRLMRRLERDLNERGRDFESVKSQYLSTVRPMHLQFVEPSRYHADIIIPNGYSEISLELLLESLRPQVLIQDKALDT